MTFQYNLFKYSLLFYLFNIFLLYRFKHKHFTTNVFVVNAALNFLLRISLNQTIVYERFNFF